MEKGRVIGLVSGKGGVGKTSLTVNLGISLSELDNEVTIVDTDFSASNIGVHLGRYDHPVKIQDVLENRRDPESAIFRHHTGIKAMVSSNEIHQVSPDLSDLEEVIQSAARESDYVIVDSPPGLDETVERVIASCDEIVVVTTPTQSSGTNAAQVVEKTKQMHKPILGTVVNMSEDDPERELVNREVEMMTDSHILGEIPYDTEVKKSLFEKQPLVMNQPLSEASIEIKRLAHRIDGRNFEEPRFAGIKRNLKGLKKTLTGN